MILNNAPAPCFKNFNLRHRYMFTFTVVPYPANRFGVVGNREILVCMLCAQSKLLKTNLFRRNMSMHDTMTFSLVWLHMGFKYRPTEQLQ